MESTENNHKPLWRRARDFAYWRWKRFSNRNRNRIRPFLYGARHNRRFEREGPEDIDPRIVFPAYKSLDAFLDVERLKSLDGFVRAKVAEYLREKDCEPFHTGVLKRGLLSKARPGSRLIYLSKAQGPQNYFALSDPDQWERTPEADDFAPLMDFIGTLPFERTARMIVMCDDQGHKVTAHRDHRALDICHEFVWFRTNLDKPFWVQDVVSGKKEHVKSYTAWFDTVNQFHGADAVDKLSISIRVDGVFTEEFRARIPKPARNPSSTASLWASLEPDAVRTSS